MNEWVTEPSARCVGAELMMDGYVGAVTLPNYASGAPVSEEDVERVIETGQADNLFQQAFATEQVGQ